MIAGTDMPESLLRVWDISDPSLMTLTAELRGHTSHEFTCRVSPGGGMAAPGGHDGTLCLWNLAAGDKKPTTIGGAFGPFVDGVAFSPKGRYLVTANGNGTIAILRVPTAAEVALDAPK